MAVIGGSGNNIFDHFDSIRSHRVVTEYGVPSDEILELQNEDTKFFFLARHGVDHRIPPHLVNYRANLKALSLMGVDQVLALNSVGAISNSIPVGELVIPDQLIDYTWGREHTIDIGNDDDLKHVDFSEPFDFSLRCKLLEAATELEIKVSNGLVIGVTQGPRLETAAEIVKLKMDGCDIVGMTSMPEAAIARELNLRYASICIVANRAAGTSTEIISTEEIRRVVLKKSESLCSILSHYLKYKL